MQQAKVQPVEQPQRRREAELKGALPNPDEKPSDQKSPEKPESQKNGPAAPPPGAKPAAPESGNQPGATPAATPPGATPAPGAPGAPPGAADVIEMGGPDDYQLSRAVDLLRGLSLMKQRAAN